MFDFVVAVNDDQVFDRNFARSPILLDPEVRVHVRRGYRSASLAYNSGLDAGKHDLVAFVHQDVYLPRGWKDAVCSALVRLDAHAPDWAVLGLFGATGEGRHVGHVWSSGLNRTLGQPFDDPIEVESIDELLIIVRRAANTRFDDRLPGFHLYGTDIAQTALSNGKGVYAICAPAVHNSRPIVYLPRDYLSAYEYLRHKWSDRLPIQTCISPIVHSRLRRLRRLVRYRIDSLRYRGVERDKLDRNLDCEAIASTVGFG